MTATARAKKPTQSAAKRPANSTIKALGPPRDDDDLDIIQISSDDVDESRVPLFAIDGDQYTMLANPPAGLALRFTKLMSRGTDAATAAAQEMVMNAMLGEDAWQTLMDCPGLRREQLQKIVAKVGRTVMGTLETPKA